MNVSMSSLLVLLHLFYMGEAKALQTYEDGANNGANYNYIYENSYLKENPVLIEDLDRPYTDSHSFENRYVPQIDGHPIFIPPLSSNQYETVNTGYYGKKVQPKHYWSSNYQNVRLLPEQMIDGAHVTHINRVPTEKRDLFYETLVKKSPQKKVSTQLESTLPVSNLGVGEKEYTQKYSYGKELKEASKSSEKVLDKIPKSRPLKLKGSIDKSTKLQSQAGKNRKYKTPINPDNLVKHIDNSYDDPAVIESRYAERFDMNYDYPNIVKDWRETSQVENHYIPVIAEKLIKENPIEMSQMENYHGPVIVEKLIKETPIEDFYDPVLMQDLTIKNSHLGNKGLDKSKYMEKFPYPNIDSGNEAMNKKKIVNANLVKGNPGISEFTNKKSHLNSNKNKDFDKSAVNDDYDEPHVIKVSKKQNPIEIYEVPTETKLIKTKPSYGEILKHTDNPVDSLSKEKSKTVVKHKPVKVSSEKPYQKYIFEGQPAKPLLDKHHTPSKTKYIKKNQIGEHKDSIELEALSKKPFVEEYDDLIKIEEKQSEYSKLDTVAENKQSEKSDSLIEHPIHHASITKKKGDTYYSEYPVKDILDENLSKPSKITSNKNKGDSAHKIKVKGHATHKVKGEETHKTKVKGAEIHKTKVKGHEKPKIKVSHKKQIYNSPHMSVPSKDYNQDYEILDQVEKTTLSNVPQVDFDEVKFENFDNVPFEVGSGIIQERDMGQDSRNLFSESGIWSQMVNFHSQERSKFKKCITPKNETGNCMPIQLCPDPNLALKLDDLVKKVCSIDDVFIGICCPEFSAETLKVDWEDFDPNHSEQENVEEMETTVACGQIVNSGEDVSSWPWMAPLISASTRRIFCGGVLINEQYVLTAAHCTRRIPRNQILVILGPINSTQEPRNQEFTVGEIKRHSRYNPRTMQNDIALLKLSKPVPMGEFRRFICLPNEMEAFVGKQAVMLGWQGSFAMTKNVEHLRVLPNEECRKNLGGDTLCTEPRTEDSMCNLDSGAPLIIQKDGSYEVIGILTWNRNDCDSRFPAIYTNVSHFRKWIEVHSSS